MSSDPLWVEEFCFYFIIIGAFFCVFAGAIHLSSIVEKEKREEITMEGRARATARRRKMEIRLFQKPPWGIRLHPPDQHNSIRRSSSIYTMGFSRELKFPSCCSPSSTLVKWGSVQEVLLLLKNRGIRPSIEVPLEKARSSRHASSWMTSGHPSSEPPAHVV